MRPMTMAFLSLARFTSSQIVRSRKWLVLLALCAAPVALLAYWSYRPDATPPFTFFSTYTYLVYLQLMLPFVTLIYGTALVSEELQSRTVTYLVSGYYTRKHFIVARYMGFIPVTWLLIALPIVVSYVIIGSTFGGLVSNLDILVSLLGVSLCGVFAYGAIFCLLGTLLSHPLVIGLLFAFLWEGVVSNLPGNIPYATMFYHLRSLLSHLVENVGFLSQVSTSSIGVALLMIAAVTTGAVYLSAHLFSRKDIL
jgi:ABC-2 type transport system permease protein